MEASKIYWNEETINHFQFISSYLSGEELYEKVQEFVEVDCVMQDGDTEEELINSLLKEINYKKFAKSRLNLNNMEFYWSDDTVEYFKTRNKPGCEGQYISEVQNFVKQNCTLENGETYEMLVIDLITKTKR